MGHGAVGRDHEPSPYRRTGTHLLAHTTTNRWWERGCRSVETQGRNAAVLSQPRATAEDRLILAAAPFLAERRYAAGHTVTLRVCIEQAESLAIAAVARASGIAGSAHATWDAPQAMGAIFAVARRAFGHATTEHLGRGREGGVEGAPLTTLLDQHGNGKCHPTCDLDSVAGASAHRERHRGCDESLGARPLRALVLQDHRLDGEPVRSGIFEDQRGHLLAGVTLFTSQLEFGSRSRCDQ